MGTITIRLMSDMCAGNGESVGYGIDSDICADNYGFPYIPGRRLLGCLRESAVHLGELGLKTANQDNIDAIFGNENGIEGKLCIGNAVIPGIESLHNYIKGLKKNDNRDYLARQCSEERIMRLYSFVRGQTKIGSDGKAEAGSLRFVRVLNQYDPINGKKLEFECSADVAGLNEKQIDLVEKACKALKHIGMNRTRGLGNVVVCPKLKEDGSIRNVKMVDNSGDEKYAKIIRYRVEFDSDITVQGYMDYSGQISSRTMIGLFAERYLQSKGNVDETFESLFLNGNVKWSALTPCVNECFSYPAPAMIMRLKNDKGRLENIFAPSDKEWKKKKPKSLDGYFAALCKDKTKSYVSKPEMIVSYHNRINETNNTGRTRKGLYMQEALRQGMVYGGYILLEKDYLEVVKGLLSEATIRLGRSKKTQYGVATITDVSIEDYKLDDITVEEDGEPIVAILRSDLVLQDNAAIKIDSDHVRRVIVENTGLVNEKPEQMNDICRYRVLTGYNNMWHMQKPKIPAVMAGSVYCFKAKKGKYSSKIIIGEYQQEGMGQIELISLNKLNNNSVIKKGEISTKKITIEKEKTFEFRQLLLYEAAMTRLQEYAFDFKKRDKDKILEGIPSSRLRQMLLEAENIADLWKMVDSMKTSDVSSESKGKKTKSEILIKELYGEDRQIVNLEKMIGDDALWKEIQNSPEVVRKIKCNWKEPMSTLLHIIHYEKANNNGRSK